MLFNKKPRWLRHGNQLITLHHVARFEEYGPNGVLVYFINMETCVLEDITLDDIHYFLKHGGPRKRKALKS